MASCLLISPQKYYFDTLSNIIFLYIQSMHSIHAGLRARLKENRNEEIF
jgi:hypothetical protein